MTRVRIAYLVAMTGYFGLLGLILLWNTWLSPPQHFPISLVVLVAAGPLLVPLRGLLHGRPYTFAWTSFLVLLYFIHGTIEAYSNAEDRPWAMLEILFSLMLYFGAIFFARLRGRELREAKQRGG